MSSPRWKFLDYYFFQCWLPAKTFVLDHTPVKTIIYNKYMLKDWTITYDHQWHLIIAPKVVSTRNESQQSNWQIVNCRTDFISKPQATTLQTYKKLNRWLRSLTESTHKLIWNPLFERASQKLKQLQVILPRQARPNDSSLFNLLLEMANLDSKVSTFH